MDIQPTDDPHLRELYSDSVIKFDEFDDVLKYLRYKLRKKDESVCLELNNAIFTLAQINTIIDTRSRSSQKRRLLADPLFILLKEKLIPGHATGSVQLQTKLASCIVNQLLAPSTTDECAVDRIRFYGDGEIKLPQFSGEPDGGLCWFGEKFPFIIVETGVSDSIGKTKGRVQHWLNRGQGDISLGIAVKIEKHKTTGTLTGLSLHVYTYDATVTLNTGTTSHSKVTHINSWNLLTGPAEISIPAAIPAATRGCPLVIHPQPNLVKVDLTAYVVAVREAVEL